MLFERSLVVKFATGCFLLVYTPRPCLVSRPSRRGRISHSDSKENLLMMLRGVKRWCLILFCMETIVTLMKVHRGLEKGPTYFSLASL